MSPDILIVAGEPSGDRWAAGLIRELLKLSPQAHLRGVGGVLMRKAGAQIICDSSGWAAIGAADAVRVGPTVLLGMRSLRKEISLRPPDVLVLIDFGAFNVRLARWARSRPVGFPGRAGAQSKPMKILYYFPPRSWSKSGTRGQLPDLVDAIAAPFAWSARRLSGGRARVEWVGHPLLDEPRPSGEVSEDRRAIARELGLDLDRPIVALAPGSRKQELERHLPLMREVARELKTFLPDVQFLLSRAPSAPSSAPEVWQAGFPQPTLVTEGLDPQAIQLADAAAVASGTATLELAIMGVPMVVVYRGSPLATLEFWLTKLVRGGIRWVSLPNIIAEREVVPELLGRRASPERVVSALLGLLEAGRAEIVRRDLKQVAEMLGPAGASERTARMALELCADGATNVARVPRP
jgi:lipid-A-disaccharide synthase